MRHETAALMRSDVTPCWALESPANRTDSGAALWSLLPSAEVALR